MTQSATAALVFAPPVACRLEVDFRGGRLTSDGGWSWVAEADQTLGLCDALAMAIPDHRRRRGRHTLLELLRQRIYQIAARRVAIRNIPGSHPPRRPCPVSGVR